MSAPDLHARALEPALAACGEARLQRLRHAHLLLTGGTGFLGQWLLRAVGLLNANGWAIGLTCTSRDPAAFRASQPWCEALGAGWITADATAFGRIDAAGGATHVVHLAASTDARSNYDDPLGAARSIVAGAEGCVALARRLGAHLHYVSSGAVYGPRRASDGPAREVQVERFAPDPLDPRQAYGNAKRMAESLVACGADDFCISRPFAFLGPGLPLHTHFAAGNFVADALQARPVRVRGDGTPLRSYMHPADYAAWTLALLAEPPRGMAVNVGSAEAVSIEQLARRVAGKAGAPVVIEGDPAGVTDPSAYWPDTARAAGLGLSLTASLERCIDDTLAWARTGPTLQEIQTA
jgi:dTDP-glucose 4,6-dehydratase